MVQNKKRNIINKHRSSYDKATEYALRAIYEGVDIKVDGQTFSYDKQHNILMIIDYCMVQKFYPKFTGIMCNPFAERIPTEVTND